MKVPDLPRLENLDEAEEAIAQRERLTRVKDFLVLQGAEEELVSAVEEAIDDIKQWIDPELEELIQRGGGRSGTA
ncbi:hypothetical protein NKH36_00105 [Mesorhizobium sp. M1312]|uniref:hypothetical protein n=1 Tax=unclassified Mesorhizobium TaxID=325217 RepID=UPI0033351157